ncbi:SOSS complex subunit B1 [Astathelohania contejeani]|uniref:SOSS complex subunit B1 n=1 Tax=Astathelohania contejeani TaxID=164912 RepID=A0ABQ7I2E3_9MICR|nr:SOSS complex subunit B1 [Thelohania contejeani]
MTISELKNQQKNIDISFIIIKEIEKRNTKENEIVTTYLVADETGSIEFSLWNDTLEPGDIMYLSEGFTATFRGKVRLFLSPVSQLTRVCTFRKSFNLEPCVS